jgi:hypothetical protein
MTRQEGREEEVEDVSDLGYYSLTAFPKHQCREQNVTNSI